MSGDALAGIFGDAWGDADKPEEAAAATGDKRQAVAPPAEFNFPDIRAIRDLDDMEKTALMLLSVGRAGMTDGDAYDPGVDYASSGSVMRLKVKNLRSRLSDFRRLFNDSAENPRLIDFLWKKTGNGSCKHYFLTADGRAKFERYITDRLNERK